MAVKEFLKPIAENGDMAILIFRVIFDQPLKLTAVYLWSRTQSFKTITFCFNYVYNIII